MGEGSNGNGQGEDEKPAETNFYKQALKNARDDVRGYIDDLTPDGGSLGESVLTHIVTNEGWVSGEADTWAEDFRGQRTGILGKFEDAYDAYNTAYEHEPDEVEADDPRGKAYQHNVN